MLVRADLSTGLQMAQVAHVCSEFALRYPDRASSTRIGVVLHVGDEDELLAYADRVHLDQEPYVLFVEEDLGNEHTALAVVCSGERFRSLPLAHKEAVMA